TRDPVYRPFQPLARKRNPARIRGVESARAGFSGGPSAGCASMKSLLAALTVLCLGALAVSAAPEPLFDGKTFDGWEGDTNKTWRIADGAIVGGSLEETVPR